MIFSFARSLGMAAAVTFCGAVHGGAQADIATATTTQAALPQSTSADKTPRHPEETALSASRLIRLLRSDPEVMVEAKSLMGESIAGEGAEESEPGNPTDDRLYAELQRSPEARARLTQFLLARGYIDENEAGLSSMASSTDTAHDMRDDQQPEPDADLLEQSYPQRPAFEQGERPSSLDSGIRPRTVRRSTMKQRLESTPDQDNSNITDEPSGLHRPAPYNLRSLRDLYTQAPEAAEHPKRFGSQLFTARALDTRLPVEAMDIPIGPDYVIGPGDELSISIWGGVAQNLLRMVDRQGRVALPEAGPIQLAGLPLGKAEDVVRQALQPQFRNAQVALTVARLRTIQIFVVGDVQRPGAYQVSSLASPITALMAAGGPTAHGSLRVVHHMRADHQLEEIDLYDFLLRGVRASEIRIQAGDTLLVPPAGPQVAILGAVKRPAIYELTGDSTLSAVLQQAGGVTVAAELSQITIERFTNVGRREVSLARAGDNHDELTARISTFEVKDGDRIRVGTVLPASDRVIYVQGHVARPGKIAYRDGMQITDVIRSYRDVLPEPSDSGELVRLVPPDLHPETVEFKLADTLIGNVSLPLQPFDTIRIFGRYEQDAPMVTIRGEVQRPGAYPLFNGMTAAQLVRMAGGFKRAAFLDKADLVSYRVIDGARVSTERTEMEIGAAVLRENPKADAPLKPGDVLTIHQLTSWGDIGASISVEGEVAHPGSYGFEDGEHLSDVLRRAGGFLPAAYPEGAILTRPEVARLEEKNRDSLIRQIEAGASAARLSPGISGAEQGATLQLIQQQQEQVLAELRQQPALGRLVIHMNSQIDSWAGTAADIELRNGDSLRIPKRPGFVLISGQVYNAAAITFQPGKSASWYLQKAGGANNVANQKDTFIIRANGSVVGRRSGTWYEHDVLSTRMEVGDTIVVPQKILGASLFWRNLLSSAQIAASVAIAASVVGL